MSAPLIPQEIYVLERYSSLEYFAAMRDAWDAMVGHVEQSLERFRQKLPPAYRNRPLPEQPDIVWGQRVLPNFQHTQREVHDAYAELLSGNMNGLNAAHNVSNDIRGQREFSDAWLDEVEDGGSERYTKLLQKAGHYARNIAPTAGAYWNVGTLGERYVELSRGPLDPPAAWPLYRLNPSVRIQTGERPPQNGIYLPDVDDSSAQLLIANEAAPIAYVGYDPETMQNVSEQATFWTLVERVPGETVPLEQGLGTVESTPSHVAAGQPCPRAGWWFTPAKIRSRRHFKQGDIFPVIEGSAYGDTYWQWSPDQSSPSL